MSCITKTLTCSAKGKITGTIRFESNEIEEAMSLAIKARDELGLHIDRVKLKRDWYNETTYEIFLSKTDTIQHFACFAEKAKCQGWE